MDQDAAVTVGVIDSVHHLLANNLDVDTATTLMALVSEDPSNWEEALGVWGTLSNSGSLRIY